MSLPPPPPRPAADRVPAGPVDRRREIVLGIERPKGWRKLGAARGEAFVRLLGAEVTFVHPGVLAEALTLPGGLVAIAAVDAGRGSTGACGRFVVLRRLGPNAVIPREEGIEGWLWTAAHGSALPVLSEQAREAPNLALLFTRPLAPEQAARCFRPEFLDALAERSPLGTPAVPGLLLNVVDPAAATDAFRRFGVLGDLTDREVAPTMRRHLPTDRPANPSFSQSDSARAVTSVAPPGR